MTKLITASLAIAVIVASNLPSLAQGVQAPPNLSQEALVAWARQVDICNGARVLGARYTIEGEAQVTCAGVAGKLGGNPSFVALLVGAGLAAAAMGSGGGNGTSSTNGTNSTN
ncbi:hypothetical protein [Thioclava nitratireducens]|uniref:hypothetical protein n=1 Tax=Thioclava nitratireducens TaxID=1915078 RepID=UPI0024803F6B|nr:hypothetical protein [Thioclava nitratireducens]WGT51382.1 hypothetical protein P0N61_04935 [Thioclava nitratireducens]